MAERTGQRTPDLAGNTQSAAIGFGNVNRLDFVTASDAQQVFACAVVRNLFGDNLGTCQCEILRQQCAKLFLQIRHMIEIGDTLLVHPGPDLPNPHFDLLFGYA